MIDAINHYNYNDIQSTKNHYNDDHSLQYIDDDYHTMTTSTIMPVTTTITTTITTTLTTKPQSRHPPYPLSRPHHHHNKLYDKPYDVRHDDDKDRSYTTMTKTTRIVTTSIVVRPWRLAPTMSTPPLQRNRYFC